MLAAGRISKSLVTPQRIASVLDWKQAAGAVMALDLTGKGTVGVAIASHPSQSAAVHTLEPIQLVEPSIAGGKNKKNAAVDERVLKRLEELVREHKVCGFVVGWPLQPEGRPGKPCGRVLHVLDRLAEKGGAASVLSKRRPFTLWDDRCIPQGEGEDASPRSSSVDDEVDSWGRSVAFSRATPPPSTGEPGDELVCRSEDRYVRPAVADSSGAGGILRHFMGSFWEPTTSYSPSAWEEERPHDVKRTANRAHSLAQEKKLFDSFDRYNKGDKVCIQEGLL